ncbi:MAG: hypothetical protein F4Z81_01790 [Gemmatimonadetes bacterium]|nr:hypothetical protein [Gemmatimonadota bacterium]MYB61807.1 hypothetical protein [Gemmatimonadota bacterium]
MKLLTLSFAVAFAVYFAHPPHDCDELETDAGHVEHCQICLCAAAFTAVLEQSSPTLPDYDIVGFAAGASQPGHPRIQAKQHRNRAPPLP